MSWPRVPLRELLETSIGGVWGKEAAVDELDVRVWRVTELKPGGRLEPATAAHRSISRRQYETRALRAGDLLLEKSGGGPTTPVGRVGLVTTVPEPAVCSNFMQLLRPRAEVVEPRFLHLYLNHLQASGGTARLQTASTNIRNIKASAYLELGIPVPPLDEQRRIVAILEDHLSRLDAAEAEISRAHAKLDALWRSALVTTRRSSSDAPRKALGQIAATSLGKMLDSKKQSGAPVSYLRNVNVRWGAFDLSDLQTTLLEPEEVAKFDLRDGDVLVCEGGEPGRCAVWRGGGSGIAFQKALHRIRINDMSEVLPEFVAAMLEEFVRAGRGDRLFTGTTIKHLPQEKLRGIEIPVPSVYEQGVALDRLADVAAENERFRSALAATTQRCRLLRQSVLTAAFSGRLTRSANNLSDSEEMIGA